MFKKEKALRNLDLIIKGMLTLKEEEFYYPLTVMRWDRVNNCGTVCCIMGWLPRFIPDGNIVWDSGSIRIISRDPDGKKGVDKAFPFASNVARELGLTESMSEAIFYGREFKPAGIEEVVGMSLDIEAISLEKATERVRKLHVYISNLDPLNIDLYENL